MTEAADGKDLWIVGGGDLVGQFHDAGLLDEVWLQYAPVTIGSGAPVLPRHVELRLEEVARNRGASRRQALQAQPQAASSETAANVRLLAPAEPPQAVQPATPPVEPTNDPLARIRAEMNNRSGR